jgi:hypothetical protein
MRHCESRRFPLVDWKHLMAAKRGEIAERFIYNFRLYESKFKFRKACIRYGPAFGGYLGSAFA